MEAYFDNSATTKCSAKAVELMTKVLLEDYGNPSSLHLKGVDAEDYIKEARNRICKTMKINENELIFTSGGTESNNLAIIGAAMANKRSGKHLITTKIEHAAVGSPMKFLEEQGFTVTYLDVDKDGIISLEELEQAITPETILVSIMYVNNEIGAVEPIEEAAKIIKEKNPNTLFHVDAIQAYGKYQIYPKRMGVDMMSVSGHKIHGPKGIGFLYVKEKTKLKPIIYGGGQQKGMRSGTENVPGAAGLGQAAMEAYENFAEKQNYLYELKQAFIEGIEDFEWAHVNGKTGRDSAPHIVSVSFDNVRSEVLLHTLEDRNIFVSAGSACSSNKPAVSATLQAIKVKKEYLDSTVRFSFSTENTMDEVDYCLEVLGEIVPVLRRYTRH
ncbi:cysteine desulfurase family protein [Roseburia sp. MSJ-14]|uniref:cysteine desulfurase family protein n=1 Tax=Roseburia sp. MSJ-14 TaxID=2841514 RepID=UPI001C0F9C96|nr:cysteine desulfurase family protein [Roseburia sp. MSJ-14]MBU5472534.1 cysteine desulfurase [Roseburia sp. MSJ-14]